MSIRIVRTLVCTLALAPFAFAQDILLNGNMDALTVGTNPDVGSPAGAWGWPQNYVNAGVVEMNPPDMSILLTSSFDPGTPGNSLMLNNLETTGNIHLTNLFTRTIDESEGTLVRVNFDIFLPTQGRGGGSVYAPSAMPKRTWTIPYWPEPPDCLTWRPSTSTLLRRRCL